MVLFRVVHQVEHWSVPGSVQQVELPVGEWKQVVPLVSERREELTIGCP